MKNSCSLSQIVISPVKIFKNVVSCLDHIWKEHKLAVLSGVIVVVAYKIHVEVKRRKRRQKWDSVGKDVVFLHSFIRGKTIPSLSPFVLKLETYLRMAGIQYEFDTDEPMGPKGKTPWITLNGEDYTDSQLIMDFLGKKFSKDFTTTLTDEQKGAGRALAIMTDEHLVWGLGHWRWSFDPDRRIEQLFRAPFILKLLAFQVRMSINQKLRSQGIGLHTNDEIQSIIMKDIQAISLYLGNKHFIMGNHPCEADCSVFAILAELVYAAPGSPYQAALQTDYQNLVDYVRRMKEEFWPDWDDILDR